MSGIAASGPIAFSELQTVFGGASPVGLSEYYANAAGGYTTGISGIPNTGGALNLSTFQGKSKAVLVTNGLIMRLDADSHTSGSTTWSDLSGNGNNFTLNNSAAFQTDGNGIKHMNLESLYAVTKTPGVSAYANATMVVFTSIKNSTGDWRTLFRHIDPNVSAHPILIQTGTNTLGVYTNGSFYSIGLDVSTVANAFTKFNMWVFRWSSTSPYLRVSINGTTTSASSTNTNTSLTQAIGYIGNNAAGGAQFWGKIAQILYYNRQLSDSEVTQTYNLFKQRYDNTLPLYLSVSFNSSTLPTIDETNSYSLTSNGTPSIVNDATKGYVLSLNGSSSVSTTATLTQSYTKMAWIYWSGSGTNNIISSALTTGPIHYFFINNSKLSAGHNGNGSVTFVQDTGIALNTWVHVCVTFNNTNNALTIYQNGVVTFSGTYVATNAWTGGGTIKIGEYGSSGATFSGRIFNVRVYNTELTQSQVQSAI